MFEAIQSFFTTPPKRPTPQLGAGMSDQDEPAIPAFQKAWKDGALFDDLFGPAPFSLHGTVGRSGANNHRPDVAKVETFLGDAGYYKPLTNDGPSGWHSTNLDAAIRSFQKDKGLEVDGFLKPGGPTISKIGSLLGGSQPAIEPEAKPEKSDPWEIKIGGRDPGDPNKLKPPKEWEIIGNGEADDEDEYPWPKAPQPVGEPVPLAARAEAPTGFMPRMPRSDTPEEQATYQQEYQQWLKDNWPKIQQNQVLVAQGYPPIDIPDPPLKPGEQRPDIEDGIPRPIPHRPDPAPQPRPTPQLVPGPEIVFGPQGGPISPANPFPMPRSPDIWKVLAGRVPKPKAPFDGHTISEDGAREHDSYAASLVRDSNPNETARYLKNVINWSGGQGRGDVADLLGRFAKVDEAKAKTLQDALHRASGERIPFRIAPLGEGLRQAPADQEITLPERNPWGSAADADRWEAGNMAKALLGKSDYKDAVTHFAGEFKRDPAAARAYTAAIFEDMAATSPQQAMQFVGSMREAGLAAAEEKKPEPAPEQKPQENTTFPVAIPPAPTPIPTETPAPKPEETRPFPVPIPPAPMPPQPEPPKEPEPIKPKPPEPKPQEPQPGQTKGTDPAVIRDADVLKDESNVPGYTKWLAEGGKVDPQWAEDHAKKVSRELYKNNPQAAENMVKEGEKAGVKVGLFAEGYQANKTAEELVAKGGYVSIGPDAGSKECVALVKAAVPELQGKSAERDWRKGEEFKGVNDPPLKPGTALANGWNGDRYPSNSSGNHALVYYGPDPEKPGNVIVVDQYAPRVGGRTGRPATKRSITPDELKGYSAIRVK